MGLADIARAGIALAHSVTADLQVDVTHKAWSAQDVNRKPTYGTAVARTGVLAYETRMVTGPDGSERVSTARLTFLGNISVSARDQITLPDGTTPPIVRVSAPADAGSAGARFVTKVDFGEGG